MITTDDIMALVRCRDPAHLQQRLEEAVADLAAERDAKAEQIRRLIRELDIACALSLKAEDERDALLEWKAAANGAGIQQEQALMCVEAERDALRQDAERFRAIRQCRKTVQLYVYEVADDPFSGGWSYKNDPEDFDKFADAAMKEQK